MGKQKKKRADARPRRRKQRTNKAKNKHRPTKNRPAKKPHRTRNGANLEETGQTAAYYNHAANGERKHRSRKEGTTAATRTTPTEHRGNKPLRNNASTMAAEGREDNRKKNTETCDADEAGMENATGNMPPGAKEKEEMNAKLYATIQTT